MSTNKERNERFKNFARLLWQDLLEANGYGYIDVSTDDDPTDPTNYLQIIAQRAYDLAKHVTTSYEKQEYDMIRDDNLNWDSLFEDIPDLTAWPEPD